ncbi:MAG: hypothetical protein ACFB13_06530 [Kiloniellaceae bacterium]
MSEEDNKSKQGAALWRRARAQLPEDWQRLADDGAPDATLLAGYLDGRLAEDEAARLEARLAGEPALLDELLALRAALDAGAETAPATVVTRAQAAYPGRPALRAVASEKPSLLGRLLGGLVGFQLRPAVSALAAAALLLGCAGAFELGRYQAQQLDTTTQLAETGDSDVPVEFVISGL